MGQALRVVCHAQLKSEFLPGNIYFLKVQRLVRAKEHNQHNVNYTLG